MDNVSRSLPGSYGSLHRWQLWLMLVGVILMIAMFLVLAALNSQNGLFIKHPNLIGPNICGLIMSLFFGGRIINRTGRELFRKSISR